MSGIYQYPAAESYQDLEKMTYHQLHELRGAKDFKELYGALFTLVAETYGTCLQRGMLASSMQAQVSIVLSLLHIMHSGEKFTSVTEAIDGMQTSLEEQHCWLGMAQHALNDMNPQTFERIKTFVQAMKREENDHPITMEEKQ